MNDFPELTPPPERDLTPAQRARIRASLPLEGPAALRPWWITVAAAAATVLVVVGGAVALSRSVGDSGNTSREVGPAGTPTQSTDGQLSFLTFGPGIECLAGAPRTVIEIDTVTPPRDLVLAGVSLEGAQGATTGGAWVAQVAPGKGMQAGSFEHGRPGLTSRAWKELGWPDRRPLHGAVLKHGKTYRVFVRVTIVNGGRLEGIRFAYTDSGRPGSSVREGTIRAATTC